jgi:hypothetical protein
MKAFEPTMVSVASIVGFSDGYHLWMLSIVFAISTLSLAFKIIAKVSHGKF